MELNSLSISGCCKVEAEFLLDSDLRKTIVSLALNELKNDKRFNFKNITNPTVTNIIMSKRSFDKNVIS